MMGDTVILVFKIEIYHSSEEKMKTRVQNKSCLYMYLQKEIVFGLMECNSTLTYATIFMFLLHNLKACTSLLSKIKISTGISITLHVLGSCKIKKKAQWASVQDIHNTKLIITKLTLLFFRVQFFQMCCQNSSIIS